MKIVFGVHNHQPYGNFPEVYEETYIKSYLPFINKVEKSRARVSLHFTGTLLEWIEKNHPEYIDKVKKLLNENRVEILSGGYYEPIMPSITSKFRIKQIEKLNNYIYEIFSYKPKGLWLAERVWEPSIIPELNSCGIEYTFLDEENFIPIEKKGDKYYVTEYEGKTIKIFVIDKKLRYLIPFKGYDEILNRLKEGNFFVSFDDGEKFGSWPGTNELCYKSDWLGRFFENMINNDVKMLLPKEIVGQEENCGGLVYIDSGSYPEMISWALPPNKKTENYKCSWKNFLIKYPEANYIHKLSFLNAKYYELPEDEEMIMASQANDAYWHGVFGGIYISHLRNALYKNILNVQKNLKWNVLKEDIDFDGKNEIIMKNSNIVIGIDPDQGGRIFEFGSFSKSYNFQNTITRRRESYHEKNIVEDWYDKFSLIDHFMEFPNFEQIKTCRFKEIGDFVNQPYKAEILNSNKIKLSRKGNIWFEGKHTKIYLTKEIVLHNNKVDIYYKINNPNAIIVPLHFATEFNFNFVSEYGDERFIMYNNKKSKVGEEFLGTSKNIHFIDKFFDLDLEIKFEETEVWTYPIKTSAMSEKDKIKSYQGTSIFINKIEKLLPESELTFCISINVK